MTLSNIIDITDDRHPLQELLVPSFIPNSCALEGGRGTNLQDRDSLPDDEHTTIQPSMMILTGPNNSGRVYV